MNIFGRNKKNLILSKILSSTSWLLIEKVLSLAVSFVVAVLLARHLGVNGFGELSYILALFALVSPVASLGLNAIVSKEIIDNPRRESIILFTSVFFRLIAGITIASIFILGVTALPRISDHERYGLIVMCIALIFSCLSVFEFWFFARMAAGKLVKIRLAVLLIFFIAKIFALTESYKYKFEVIVTITALESMAFGFVYLLMYRISTNVFNTRISVDIAYGISLLRRSSWLIFSGVLATINFKVDQVMLRHMVSDSAVGIYSAAVKVAEVCYYVGDAIVITVFPLLLEYRKRNRVIYLKRLQLLSDGLFGVSIAMILVFFSTGWYLIPALLGEEYSESVAILNIHIFSCILMYFRLIASKWIIAEEYLSLSLISHGIGAAINVALNFVLIPRYSGMGAAVATIISYLFSCYFVFLFHKRYRVMGLIMTRSLIIPIRVVSKAMNNSKYGDK